MSGVTVVFRAGEQEQTPPEGFESSGSETVLGTEVKYDTPIIPVPLKQLLPDYKRMEEKIDAVIREKYGLPPVMSTPVKYADLIMLATERRDLGLDDGSLWPVLEGIPATEMFKVIPLAPGHAYGMFMERFNELSELRKCA
ncbi:TPA: HD family hydrolase [Escherichia coli]